MLAAIRVDMKKRQAIAMQLSPHSLVQASAEGFHVWLKFPYDWPSSDFAARLLSAGDGVRH